MIAQECNSFSVDMFKKEKKEKIFVALSGGVDSAVAAYLLKQEGHEVLGGFIKGYNVDGCQDSDAEDAAKVAAHLDIPFYVFDMEKEYEKRVVDYLLDGYKKGVTPNPDVVCNSEIKFGLFYDQAMKLGADAVASGHYAILKPRMHLYEAKDKTKDQSYFLWQVPKERLEKILFPLGKLKKDTVRAIARKAGLPNADKKDSQGICFLGKFDFNEFLKEKLGAKEGDVVDVVGNVIGSHYGVHLYTIGQRHGFVNKTNKPLYVIAKDVARNTLTAVHEWDDELNTDQFITRGVMMLDVRSEKKLKDGEVIRVYGRCRYHQPAFACDVRMGGSRNGVSLPPVAGENLLVTLKKRQAIFPAAGQSFVMYTGRGKVLGGAIIQGYEN